MTDRNDEPQDNQDEQGELPEERDEIGEQLWGEEPD